MPSGKFPAFLDIPGTTSLHRAVLNSFEDVADYFGPGLDDSKNISSLIQRLQERDYQRDALADLLEDYVSELNAPDCAKHQVKELRRNNSVVVFAGQQPGLFGGPLYGIYKALTAEHWARAMSAEYAITVIPCFWLAADDHDFAEVNHINFPSNGSIRTIQDRPEMIGMNKPIGTINLDDKIKLYLDELAGFLPDNEFKQQVMATLGECYQPGVSYPVAFARLWYAMFPQSRLLFVPSMHNEIKKLARPMMQKAVLEHHQLYELFESTNSRLQNAGYDRQVHKKRSQSFLFYQKNSRYKVSVNSDYNFSWADNLPVNSETLSALLAANPQDFSGNVLLNPIIQNGLFPTLGVVLGPSEIGYYAQICQLFDGFHVPRPVVMPRISLTLIEPHARERLKKLSVDLEMLRVDHERELARVLAMRYPEGFNTAFESAAQMIEKSFLELGPMTMGIDPTLEKSLNYSRDRAVKELNKFKNKVGRFHNRTQKDIEGQIRALALQLFPDRGLQERTFNIIQYWARYGPDFLARLYDQWPISDRQHLLREIN